MEKILKIAQKGDEGIRLDAFLSASGEWSRSRIAKLFEQGLLRLNGEIPQKLGLRLKEGDRLELRIPPPEPLSAVKTQMEIPILYEDQDLAVINKPRGLVVHPAPGHGADTLVNGLLYAMEGELSGIGGELRPGIVHRLDKDTTGLLVVAKSDRAHIALSAQIKARQAAREDLALVEGNLRADEGSVEAPIGRSPRDRKKMAVLPGGRWAKTNYRVLERYKAACLLWLKLETGRTHQIRVHMKEIGHPVCGDVIYGPQAGGRIKNCPLMLHAAALSFAHPASGDTMRFEAEPPEDFQSVLERLTSL
ncbi:MAG: RluA family pseudouridine synthase [Christensenellaceae bacterium]|nr:RluA family pseudouridine synthase [Christensenellaceae bacterium]